MRIDFTPIKPKLKLDFTSYVYMFEKTHSYLLVERQRNHDLFLRLGNGCIEIIKLGKESSLRKELVPLAYDFKKAVNVFYMSHLTRTSRVERIMREILGIRTDDIKEDTEEEIQQATEKTGTSKEAYSLQDLCSEISMDPTLARKILRSKMKKPEFGWKWASREDANLARAILTDAQL